MANEVIFDQIPMACWAVNFYEHDYQHDTNMAANAGHKSRAATALSLVSGVAGTNIFAGGGSTIAGGGAPPGAPNTDWATASRAQTKKLLSGFLMRLVLADSLEAFGDATAAGPDLEYLHTLINKLKLWNCESIFSLKSTLTLSIKNKDTIYPNYIFNPRDDGAATDSIKNTVTALHNASPNDAAEYCKNVAPNDQYGRFLCDTKVNMLANINAILNSSLIYSMSFIPSGDMSQNIKTFVSSIAVMPPDVSAFPDEEVPSIMKSYMMFFLESFSGSHLLRSTGCDSCDYTAAKKGSDYNYTMYIINKTAYAFYLLVKQQEYVYNIMMDITTFLLDNAKSMMYGDDDIKSYIASLVHHSFSSVFPLNDELRGQMFGFLIVQFQTFGLWFQRVVSNFPPEESFGLHLYGNDVGSEDYWWALRMDAQNPENKGKSPAGLFATAGSPLASQAPTTDLSWGDAYPASVFKEIAIRYITFWYNTLFREVDATSSHIYETIKHQITALAVTLRNPEKADLGSMTITLSEPLSVRKSPEINYFYVLVKAVLISLEIKKPEDGGPSREDQTKFLRSQGIDPYVSLINYLDRDEFDSFIANIIFSFTLELSDQQLDLIYARYDSLHDLEFVNKCPRSIEQIIPQYNYFYQSSDFFGRVRYDRFSFFKTVRDIEDIFEDTKREVLGLATGEWMKLLNYTTQMITPATPFPEPYKEALGKALDHYRAYSLAMQHDHFITYLGTKGLVPFFEFAFSNEYSLFSIVNLLCWEPTKFMDLWGGRWNKIQQQIEQQIASSDFANALVSRTKIMSYLTENKDLNTNTASFFKLMTALKGTTPLDLSVSRSIIFDPIYIFRTYLEMAEQKMLAPLSDQAVVSEYIQGILGIERYPIVIGNYPITKYQIFSIADDSNFMRQVVTDNTQVPLCAVKYITDAFIGIIILSTPNSIAPQELGKSRWSIQSFTVDKATRDVTTSEIYSAITPFDFYNNIQDTVHDIAGMKVYISYSSLGSLSLNPSMLLQNGGSDNIQSGGTGQGPSLFPPYNNVTSKFNSLTVENPSRCGDTFKEFARMIVGFAQTNKNVCVYPLLNKDWKEAMTRILGVSPDNSLDHLTCADAFRRFFAGKDGIYEYIKEVSNDLQNALLDAAQSGSLKNEFIATPKTNLNVRFFCLYLKFNLEQAGAALLSLSPAAVSLEQALAAIAIHFQAIKNGFDKEFVMRDPQGSYTKYSVDGTASYRYGLFTLPKPADFKKYVQKNSVMKDNLMHMAEFNMKSRLLLSYLQIIVFILTSNKLQMINSLYNLGLDKGKAFSECLKELIEAFIKGLEQIITQAGSLLNTGNGKVRSLTSSEVSIFTYISVAAIPSMQTSFDTVVKTEKVGEKLFNFPDDFTGKPGEKLLYDEYTLMMNLMKEKASGGPLGGKGISNMDKDGLTRLKNFIQGDDGGMFKPTDETRRKKNSALINFTSDWDVTGKSKYYIPFDKTVFGGGMQELNKDLNAKKALAIIWKSCGRFLLNNTGFRINNASQLKEAHYGFLSNPENIKEEAPGFLSNLTPKQLLSSEALWNGNAVTLPAAAAVGNPWNQGVPDDKSEIPKVATVCSVFSIADAAGGQCPSVASAIQNGYGVEYGVFHVRVSNMPGVEIPPPFVQQQMRMITEIKVTCYLNKGPKPTPCSRDGEAPKYMAIQMYVRNGTEVAVNIGNLYSWQQQNHLNDTDPSTMDHGLWVDLTQSDTPLKAENALARATQTVLSEAAGTGSWNNFLTKIKDPSNDGKKTRLKINNSSCVKLLGDGLQELRAWVNNGGWVAGNRWTTTTPPTRKIAPPCPTFDLSKVGNDWNKLPAYWAGAPPGKPPQLVIPDTLNHLNGFSLIDGQDQPSGYRNLLAIMYGRGTNPWSMGGYSHIGHQKNQYRMEVCFAFSYQAPGPLPATPLMGGEKIKKTKKNRKHKKHNKSKLQKKKVKNSKGKKRTRKQIRKRKPKNSRRHKR